MNVAVVLDTEALSLLTPGRRHDPGRRRVMAHVEDADWVLTPRAARVEAMTPRDARHAELNRLVRDAEDIPPLRDRGRRIADAAASARSRLGTDVAVVDALVGAVAAAVKAEVVEILTADAADITAVADALDASVDVVSV
jgi:hypothetical protein